ncbi:MAG: ABC transporter permease [Anaerolineae bacterium]
MNWRAIWAIARKDIVDAVKNMYILFGLVLPIGLSFLMRLAFPVGGEERILTVAVYDPGGSRFVAGLQVLPEVQLLTVASAEELPEVVKVKATGGLAVPVGFDEAVQAGHQPELTVYVNSRRGGGELAAFGSLVQQQVWALVEQEMPARIVRIPVASGPGIGDDFRLDRYLLVLLVVMALAMTGTFVVPMLLVEEKERHTLEALLVSPAGPPEVAVGKAIVGLVYSTLVAAVLVALNRGWEGDWPVTELALLLGALFLVLVGLLMGGFFHSVTQVNTWSSIVMLITMLPSWLTVVQIPVPLEVLFRLIPTHYLAQAMGLALAGDASPARVWGNLAVLLASTVIAFAAVVWRLRRETE